mgnify:CR=1 FL=1
MANVRTFDLHILFQSHGRDYARTYYNISRTAVKYLLEWHQENPDYCHHNLFMNA